MSRFFIHQLPIEEKYREAIVDWLTNVSMDKELEFLIEHFVLELVYWTDSC